MTRIAGHLRKIQWPAVLDQGLRLNAAVSRCDCRDTGRVKRLIISLQRVDCLLLNETETMV